MKINKTWAIFTVILLLICVALASHLSYRGVAKHYREQKVLALSGSWDRTMAPAAPMPAPAEPITTFAAPSTPVAPEVTIAAIVAKYEMIGMISSGFFGFLGVALPYLLKKKETLVGGNQ